MHSLCVAFTLSNVPANTDRLHRSFLRQCFEVVSHLIKTASQNAMRIRLNYSLHGCHIGSESKAATKRVRRLFLAMVIKGCKKLVKTVYILPFKLTVNFLFKINNLFLFYRVRRVRRRKESWIIQLKSCILYQFMQQPQMVTGM